MTLEDMLADIQALEADLLAFERKYGLSSDAVYAMYQAGEEPENDSWILDYGEWASCYALLLLRRSQHQAALDILRDISVLQDEMRVYERRYGILSDAFYAAYRGGEEPPDDSWVRDWTAWASSYQLWLDCKQQIEQLLAG